MYKKIVIVSIMALLVMSFIGCSKETEVSTEKSTDKLIECFNLTKNIDSVEVDLNTTTYGGQSEELNIHMKAENINSDLKSLITYSDEQEFYLSIKGNKANLYMKDNSGSYTVVSKDKSEIGEFNIKKSFDGYIDIIEDYPDFVSKVDDNQYLLEVPKEKISEIYSEISGQSLPVDLDSLEILFTIGEEGYLKYVNLKINSEDISLDYNTKYFNYNKEFNITLPDV
ncbi:MAG: hypothetical protein ACOCRK_01750 [bacterium]